MKRKLFLTALSLGITSALFVAATTRADDTKSSTPGSTSTSKSDQGGAGTGSATTTGQSQKLTRATQLTSAQVKSSSGESLGQINDLLVNPNNGRIEFAVISLTGGTQNGKLTAIPWQLIRASGEGQSVDVTANVEQSKLATAETFDQTQWPDMNQPTWAQNIYSHYGVQRGGRGGIGGRVPIGGSESGTGASPSKSGSDTGTSPDGKGTFNNPATSPASSSDSKDGLK